MPRIDQLRNQAFLISTAGFDDDLALAMRLQRYTESLQSLVIGWKPKRLTGGQQVHVPAVLGDIDPHERNDCRFHDVFPSLRMRARGQAATTALAAVRATSTVPTGITLTDGLRGAKEKTISGRRFLGLLQQPQKASYWKQISYFEATYKGKTKDEVGRMKDERRAARPTLGTRRLLAQLTSLYNPGGPSCPRPPPRICSRLGEHAMPRLSHSRRQWLQSSASIVGSAAAVVSFDVLKLLAADSLSETYTPANGFGRMVQEYFVEQVRAIERERRQREAKLKTKADAEAYVSEVRREIADSFGAWPERTPLNPQITGIVERDAYRIEKVIFESRPQFFVTGNLYVPKGAKFPAPAVLCVCGHSDNGKAHGAVPGGLPRAGAARLRGLGLRSDRPRRAISTAGRASAVEGAHSHELSMAWSAISSFLSANSLAPGAWDGIRALDYLLSRQEVDPTHAAITGRSGGGTETTWLAGADRRITMAAPNSFVTSFLRNLENELSADTEQFPPRALALRLEQSDFLAAMAPSCVVAATRTRQLRRPWDDRSVRTLKRLYTLLGQPENVTIHIGPESHGYHQPAHEAMYACFNRACGKDGPAVEPALVLEKDRTLWCTKSGQVAELDSRPVPSSHGKWPWSWRQGAAWPARGPAHCGSRDVETSCADGLPYYRILRPRKGRSYPLPWFSIYAIETEPQIQAVVYRLSVEAPHPRPPQQTNRAIVYVAHDSSDAELREEPLIKELLAAEPAATLYTCDLRGLGESRPNTFGSGGGTHHFGSDFVYAEHAIMLDRPYAGMRTHDLLVVLDWVAGSATQTCTWWPKATARFRPRSLPCCTRA